MLPYQTEKNKIRTKTTTKKQTKIRQLRIVNVFRGDAYASSSCCRANSDPIQQEPLPSRLSRRQHCVSHRYYCVALLDASVTDVAKKYQCRLDSGEHL